MGHTLGGAPREDGTKADLDPTGHEKEGPGQQARQGQTGNQDLGLRTQDPSVWLHPSLLASTVSTPGLSTQPFLTESCFPGQMEGQLCWAGGIQVMLWGSHTLTPPE